MLEKVKDRIEEGNLDRYAQIIESLVEEEYSTLDVAAALLKEDGPGRRRGRKAELFRGAPAKASQGDMVRLCP